MGKPGFLPAAMAAMFSSVIASARSMPVQKWSPSAVSTMHLTSSSQRAPVHTARRSACICALIALRTSGRLRDTQRMPSSSVTSRVS